MSKIAVIGDRDSILGFKALGLGIFAVNSSEGALDQLKALMGGDYAAIFITENYAAPVVDRIAELEKEITLYPSIVIIPSHHGGQGLGMEKTRLMIEKAIGMSYGTEKE
ncbi:MAG: V-type ATP synthase subunit F [bacterium]